MYLEVTNLATLSTEDIIPGIKLHKLSLKKLRRLSRKQKRSQNHNEAKIKIAKLHARIKI